MGRRPRPAPPLQRGHGPASAPPRPAPAARARPRPIRLSPDPRPRSVPLQHGPAPSGPRPVPARRKPLLAGLGGRVPVVCSFPSEPLSLEENEARRGLAPGLGTRVLASCSVRLPYPDPKARKRSYRALKVTPSSTSRWLTGTVQLKRRLSVSAVDAG